MAEKIKLTEDEKWLEKTFGTPVEKVFVKELAKDPLRKALDKRISAYRDRCDNLQEVVKDIDGSLKLKILINTGGTAATARKEIDENISDATNDSRKGEIGRAHLALDTTFESIEEHLIMDGSIKYTSKRLP